MQILTLNFSHKLSDSLQVGDVVYWCPITPQGTLPTSFSSGNLGGIIRLGEVIAFVNSTNPATTPSTVNVWWDNTAVTAPSLPTDFIMFVKNKVVNTPSLVGYYADVQFENDSIDKIELFSVGSEIFESSK